MFIWWFTVRFSCVSHRYFINAWGAPLGFLRGIAHVKYLEWWVISFNSICQIDYCSTLSADVEGNKKAFLAEVICKMERGGERHEKV